jgi:hypothetical protein
MPIFCQFWHLCAFGYLNVPGTLCVNSCTTVLTTVVRYLTTSSTGRDVVLLGLKHAGASLKQWTFLLGQLQLEAAQPKFSTVSVKSQSYKNLLVFPNCWYQVYYYVR